MATDPLDDADPDWFESAELTAEQRAAAEALVDRFRRPIKPGDPRAHHFIARWFLERFATVDKRLVRITIADPTSPSPPTSIENVAQMRDWYTFHDIEVGPTVMIEKMLADVDGAAKQPFRRMTAPGGYFFPPQQFDRIAINTWLAFQAVRGPGHRRRQEVMADMLAKATLDPETRNEIASQTLADDDVVDPRPEQLEAASQLDDIEADPGRGFVLGNMLGTALGLIPAFAQRFVAVVRFPATGLLLPDEPLHLYMLPEHRNPLMGVGYGTADQIHLPVDRSTALILHNDEVLGDTVIEMPDDRIDEFNAAVVWNAHSEIYAHPDGLYRLDRIELPSPERPFMQASGADFIRARVDGLNEPARRQRARRFRKE